MKQPIKTTEAIFPMPVLLIATYNEDGSIDVMNAAWGTMLERDRVALNLTETHKTVENIKRTRGFVIHIADAAHVVAKSKLVNAPVINELPIAMECEFIEYQSDETGIGVIGKVLQTSVEADKMKDGKVDVDALKAITFDPYTHGYYLVAGRVGEAFKDGLKLKK